MKSLQKKVSRVVILTCGHCKVGRHLRLCSKLTSHHKKDKYTKKIYMNLLWIFEVIVWKILSHLIRRISGVTEVVGGSLTASSLIINMLWSTVYIKPIFMHIFRSHRVDFRELSLLLLVDSKEQTGINSVGLGRWESPIYTACTPCQSYCRDWIVLGNN